MDSYSNVEYMMITDDDGNYQRQIKINLGPYQFKMTLDDDLYSEHLLMLKSIKKIEVLEDFMLLDTDSCSLYINYDKNDKTTMIQFEVSDEKSSAVIYDKLEPEEIMALIAQLIQSLEKSQQDISVDGK